MLPSWPCSTPRQSQTEPPPGIREPSRFHRQRFLAWMPVAEAGRCSHADAVPAGGAGARTADAEALDGRGAGRPAAVTARRCGADHRCGRRRRRPVRSAPWRELLELAQHGQAALIVVWPLDRAFQLRARWRHHPRPPPRVSLRPTQPSGTLDRHHDADRRGDVPHHDCRAGLGTLTGRAGPHPRRAVAGRRHNRKKRPDSAKSPHPAHSQPRKLLKSSWCGRTGAA